MKYFVDENQTHHLADVLGHCSIDAVSPEDVFGCGSLDPEWLPQIAAQDRVVLTADKGIRRKPSENTYFRARGLTVVFLPNAVPGDTDLAKMVWLLRVVEVLERNDRKVRPGLKIAVKSGGRIEAYSEEARAWVPLKELR